MADNKTICFTGHRPKDLFGYGNGAEWDALRTELANTVERYADKGVTRFISGGAQGIDQLAFWAVDDVKKRRPDLEIRNEVFIPFKGQESRWPEDTRFGQREYRAMLEHADAVVDVSEMSPETDRVKLLFERNKAMLRESNAVIAGLKHDAPLFERGGTAHTVRNAAQMGLSCDCIDPFTREHRIATPDTIAELRRAADTRPDVRGCARELGRASFKQADAARDISHEFMSGDLAYLSNFSEDPFEMRCDDGKVRRFHNVEAAFQAQKDISRADEFTDLNGKEAKALGNKVTLREDWNAVRRDWMTKAIRCKFDQNPHLAEKLANTEGPIIEHNSWGDTTWGVSNGTGDNFTGIALMQVREECREKLGIQKLPPELLTTYNADIAIPNANGKMRVYPTAESAFQAMKNTAMTDKLCDRNGYEAISLSSSLKPHALWDADKHNDMLSIQREKFKQNPEIADVLLKFDGNLEYPYDELDAGLPRSQMGASPNQMGKILNQVRQEIQAERMLSNSMSTSVKLGLDSPEI